MIIYSEGEKANSQSKYKATAASKGRRISSKSSVVKAPTLSRDNKFFLKRIGLKLKVKKSRKQNVKHKK